MPQTNDKIIRFLVKGNTANVVLTTPLDNIIDDVLDAKTLADHLKADKPLTLTPSASGTYLVLSIDDKALCYVAEYEKTTYADFIANKGKPIAIKDGNLITPVSTYFEEYYAKMYAYVDKDIYIYQLNINNEWSRTKLDNASVVKAQPNLTTFEEIKNADYAYLVGTENWIYTLSEKRSDVISFVNIGNDMRHIWSVTQGDIWTLTDESLCDNKMDKNPATINVGNGKLVVTNEGQIVLSTADNLVLNSTTLSGNVSNNVLKNLTQYFPEGNPLLLFAEKDASQYYYNKDLDIATLSTFFNGWTQADGSIKNALSKKMTMMNLSEVTFDILLSAYNNGGTVCIKEPNTGYVYFPCKYDAANKQFTYVTLLFYSETTGAEMRCLVQTYGEDNKLTFKYNIVLNDKYISGDNNVIVRQTGSRQYSILLNAETLEVEEQ